MTNNNNELYNNLLETLKNSGQYDKLQAQTYQNIFEVLSENSAERPELPVENVLINSLIFDYLRFLGEGLIFFKIFFIFFQKSTSFTTEFIS